MNIKLTNGEINLTPAQIMSFYRLSKQPQAVGHMEYGGVLQAPITAIGTDGKVRVVKSNKPVVLTAADIKTITSELSAEQIKVADAIGAFFDGPVADWATP